MSDENCSMLKPTAAAVQVATVPARSDKTNFYSCKTKFGHQVFVVQWTFMLASSILAYFYVGDLVQGFVNKSLVISPSSDFFNLWTDPPVTPEMKIYLFNVTNADRWLKGDDAKLILKEIGPFVYREYWTKTNVTFDRSNSTVSYRAKKRFQFQPATSADENVNIVLPNLPLFSAAASMKTADTWTLMGFKTALSMMGAQSTQLFVTKTAKEFIWGYDDQLTAMGSLMLPEDAIGEPGKFGLMAGKNSTEGDWFTIETGDFNQRKISNTVSYKGKDHFNAWNTKTCNKVHGSDGSYYPPWVYKGDELSLFVPELCSAIRVSTDGEEIVYGDNQIKTLRFRPSPDMFDYDLPENHCYCSTGDAPASRQELNQEDDEEIDEESETWFGSFTSWFKQEEPEPVDPHLKCPPKGLLHLGPCKFDAPLSVSWPHFYKADPAIQNGVEGLDIPTDDAHGFRIDIQPLMGLGLAANIRMQINLQMENTKIITTLPIQKDDVLYVPIMWFDDVIGAPPADLMDLIGQALDAGPKTAQKIVIFAGILLAAQICIYAAYNIWKRTSDKKSGGSRDVEINFSF